MFSHEIEQELNHLKCFKGVYSKNNLPLRKLVTRPIAFIINTQNSDEPGEHWVGLFVAKNNIAEFFDSFGRNPLCCEIKKFLIINDVKILIINKNIIQNIFSDNCGRYCILFIKLKCNGMTFSDFLKLFNKNTLSNEILIENLI